MAMISTLRLGLPFALLVLLAGSAAAAPFDGPRWEDFGGERYPLHVVPGAISVTWAPGVVATWPEDAPPLGPDTLRVDGVDFVRVGAIGGNRFFTERYDARAPLDAEGTATVARALLSHPDVQVASPLWATSPTDHAEPWAVTDQVLLQLSDPAGESAMRTLAASMGITTLRERGLAPHQWLLKIPQNAAVDPIEAAMTLEAAPFVRWAEVDWLVPMYERYVPADPGYADQWHLNNTGQQGGLVDADMDVQEAWDLTLGDVDVIVSAQDSGVDVDHPDLVQDLLPGYDFVNGDTDPSGSSHGTSVAGCMAAPENGEGVVGVCPLCKILPLRVIGASNSAQADAHDFSVTNGAAVINNSWGPSDNADPTTPQPIPDVVATAVESAVATGRDGKGVAIFWAGGNGHNNGQTCSQDGYVSHPDTIGVGASTNMAERSGYSERCPELELSGPSTGGSTGIHTTNNNGYTYTFGGTSAASPNTAGVAALVLSALPDVVGEAVAAGEDSLFSLDMEGGEETFHISQRGFRLQGRPHRLYLFRRMTRELSRQEVATWKKVIRVLSHELNNSLAPISSMAHSGGELVRRGNTESLSGVFAAIGERARHLHEFIAGYARFAKLPTPRVERVEWDDLVQSLAGHVEFRVAGKLPDTPAWLDRAQIEQVLINMLKNAHEAGSPAEAVELQVTRTGKDVCIDISDRGSGMNETVLANALLPFYSTKRSGTGLGLALTREIVEAHGGRLQLSNRANGGLRVRIHIPAAPGQ